MLLTTDNTTQKKIGRSKKSDETKTNKTTGTVATVRTDKTIVYSTVTDKKINAARVQQHHHTALHSFSTNNF